MEQFNMGDKVTWISQAQGSAKQKIGTVVEVVQPGRMPDRGRFASLYRGSGLGRSRNHKSYVVQLDRTPGLVPKYHWPLAALLDIP